MPGIVANWNDFQNLTLHFSNRSLNKQDAKLPPFSSLCGQPCQQVNRGPCPQEALGLVGRKMLTRCSRGQCLRHRATGREVPSSRVPQNPRWTEAEMHGHKTGPSCRRQARGEGWALVPGCAKPSAEPEGDSVSTTERQPAWQPPRCEEEKVSFQEQRPELPLSCAPAAESLGQTAVTTPPCPASSGHLPGIRAWTRGQL